MVKKRFVYRFIYRAYFMDILNIFSYGCMLGCLNLMIICICFPLNIMKTFIFIEIPNTRRNHDNFSVEYSVPDEAKLQILTAIFTKSLYTLEKLSEQHDSQKYIVPFLSNFLDLCVHKIISVVFFGYCSSIQVIRPFFLQCFSYHL